MADNQEPATGETTKCRVKPVIILPPTAMSAEHMEQLRANGICVVECKDPDGVRFLEPPPADYSICERAAIELFRSISSQRGSMLDRQNLIDQYVAILLRGSCMAPPHHVPEPKRGAKK
jgi:hypothetical protein